MNINIQYKLICSITDKCTRIKTFPVNKETPDNTFSFYVCTFVAMFTCVALYSSLRFSEEETRFHLDGPEVSNGKALLIRDTEAIFNVNANQRKSKPKPTKTLPQTADNRPERPTPPEYVPTRNLQNSTLPLASVRLPKLPAKPPDSITMVSKLRRKRRRMEGDSTSKGRRERRSSRKRNTSSSTPTELPLQQTDTPDMLASEAIDYIKPVYVDTNMPVPSSRPSTAKASREDSAVNRSMQTESNV